VALLVKLSLNNGERLSTAHKSSGFYLVSGEHLTKEVGSGFVTGSSSSSMTSRSEGADGWSAPEPEAGGPSPVYSGSS
jgi:hypothetical protein